MSQEGTCAGCDKCGDIDEGVLYGNVDGRHLCCSCWKKAGRPFPQRRLSEVDFENAATKVRQKMLYRGGNQRYMARSGKA